MLLKDNIDRRPDANYRGSLALAGNKASQDAFIVQQNDQGPIHLPLKSTELYLRHIAANGLFSFRRSGGGILA